MHEKVNKNARILHDFCPKNIFPEFPPRPVSYAYECRGSNLIIIILLLLGGIIESDSAYTELYSPLNGSTQ